MPGITSVRNELHLNDATITCPHNERLKFRQYAEHSSWSTKSVKCLPAFRHQALYSQIFRRMHTLMPAKCIGSSWCFTGSGKTAYVLSVNAIHGGLMKSDDGAPVLRWSFWALNLYFNHFTWHLSNNVNQNCSEGQLNHWAIQWLIHWPRQVHSYIWHRILGLQQVYTLPCPLFTAEKVTTHPSRASVIISYIYYVVWMFEEVK